MDRRTFIQSSTVATAAAVSGTALVANEVPKPAINRLADPLPTALGSHFRTGYLRDRAERLNLRLGEASDGRLRLAFTNVGGERDGPNHALGPVEAEAFFTSEADLVDEMPEFAFFSGLPGGLGLSPEDFLTWLSAGSGQQFWDILSAAHGHKSLAVGHSGRRSGWWSDIALEHVGDLKNRPIITSGVGRAVANELGMLPLETLNSTRQPIVEPLMGQTAYVAHSSWGPEYREEHPTRFYFRRGLMHHGVVFSLRVSRARWEQLSSFDRTLLSVVANEHFTQSVAEHDAHDREVAPHLLAARGVRQYNLSSDVARAIADCSASVIDDIRTRCPDFRPLHDSFMNYRRLVVAEEVPLSEETTV
ncbi:MAG: hypothetical protein ACR2PG_02280 [Hyphomicrobiaceae bacterium]